jgi:predicted secreted hydrolase
MRKFILALILILITATLAVLIFLPAGESEQITGQVVAAPAVVEGFARADGPRPLAFPADFGAHPEFRTEWWYYTGNLETADRRHFGYELTFFRGALLPEGQAFPRQSEWATNQIYMAHFALTDVQSGEFHAFQRYSRGAAQLAGSEGDPYQVWLEDWRVDQTAENVFVLHAANNDLAIDFELTDVKGPILHGEDGYSQKGPGAGNASYYYSQTRLETQGSIRIGQETFEVRGLSWKDHEYSTSVMSLGQIGWDWFSIQLDDDYELMLYQIRRADGSVDPFSSGTLIFPDGGTLALASEDFSIEALGSWHSPHSDADYPMGWIVSIPGEGLELELTPYLEDQELNLTTIYWEGAVRIAGTHDGQPIIGNGYVELTGYAAPFNGDF